METVSGTLRQNEFNSEPIYECVPGWTVRVCVVRAFCFRGDIGLHFVLLARDPPSKQATLPTPRSLRSSLAF